MKFNAILFDLDGTLLDTAPDFITATQRLAREIGHPRPAAAAVRSAVTHGSTGILKQIFAVNETAPNFAATRQMLLDFYYDCLTDQTRPFDGIPELLAQAERQQVPWGIVTNKPLLYTNAILERLAIRPAPGTVVCPDHISNTKPDPEPVLLACRQLSVNPGEAVYIGDHERDIRSGRMAGAATIAAAYGYLDPDDNPGLWEADHVVQHPGEILKLLM